MISIAISIISAICVFFLLNYDGKRIQIIQIEFFKSYLFADDTEMVPASFLSYEFDHANSTADTTGPGIRHVLRSILSTNYGPAHADAFSFDATEAGRTFPL